MIEIMLDGLLGIASAALPFHTAVLSPGSLVSWDFCQCGGGEGKQLWVRLVSITPFQTATITYPCGGGWNVLAGIGALRCVAVLDDNGDPPSPDEQAADTRLMVADMEALSEAIHNMSSVYGVEKISPMSWTPLGPDGGCAGGEWQVQIKVGCLS